MKISFVLLIFLLLSDQVLGKSLRGANRLGGGGGGAPGAPPAPVEESQVYSKIKISSKSSVFFSSAHIDNYVYCSAVWHSSSPFQEYARHYTESTTYKCTCKCGKCDYRLSFISLF